MKCSSYNSEKMRRKKFGSVAGGVIFSRGWMSRAGWERQEWGGGAGLPEGRELLRAAGRTSIRRIRWGGASGRRCTSAVAAAAHGNDQSDR